jgi:anti-anti-sigma regulatory factor
MIAAWLKIEEGCIVQALREAAKQLDCAEGEMVLDFASVRRVDPSALRAMEELAEMAEDKAVNIILYSVSVDLYRVLKLVRLAPRFSYGG